jgi:nicotinamide mononucleotide transporter
MTNLHSLEIIAVLCGVLNIYLAARAHLLNWVFGIATVSLYFIIFFKTKLYADMSLQLIFFVLQFYGWYLWMFGSETHSKIAIQKKSKLIFFYCICAASFLFIPISYILFSYTDSTTIFIDALITALSLVAQWMMSKKWLEHWWLWMIIDIISIKMFLQKELYFTSGLYAVLFFICVYGYLNWQKQMKLVTA